MRFVLEINSGNDAVSGDLAHWEVARLLGRAKEQVAQGAVKGPLMDSNGNRVGGFRFEESR